MPSTPPVETTTANGENTSTDGNLRDAWEHFLATLSPEQQGQFWQIVTVDEDQDIVEPLDLGDIHTTPPLPGRYEPLPEVFVLKVSVEGANQVKQEKRLGISFASFSVAKQHAEILFVAIFDQQPLTTIFDDGGVSSADVSGTTEDGKTAVITVSSLPVLSTGFLTQRSVRPRGRRREQQVRFEE